MWRVGHGESGDSDSERSDPAATPRNTFWTTSSASAPVTWQRAHQKEAGVAEINLALFGDSENRDVFEDRPPIDCLHERL